MPTNTDTHLPVDKDSAPIQVLAPVETTVAQASIGAANDRQPLPSGAQIVEVATSDGCRFVFGDSSVDATSGTRRILPPNALVVYRVPAGATHFAVVRIAAEAGIVTVTRLI